jgi:hypothetical protein
MSLEDFLQETSTPPSSAGSPSRRHTIDSFIRGSSTPRVTDLWKQKVSPMVYTCNQCTYKSFTRIMLNKHMVENHDCSTSEESIVSKVAMSEKKRKRLFHSPSLKRTLSVKPNIKLSKIQSEANLLKKCFSPDKRSVTKLEEHVTHTLDSPMVYTCNNCDFKTFLGTSLKEHKRQLHPEESE